MLPRAPGSPRRRWLTEHRQVLACWFYIKLGLCAAGDEALSVFADELVQLNSALAVAVPCGVSGLTVFPTVARHGPGRELGDRHAAGRRRVPDRRRSCADSPRGSCRGGRPGRHRANSRSIDLPPARPAARRRSRPGPQDHPSHIRPGGGSQRTAAEWSHRLRLPAVGKPADGHRPVVRQTDGNFPRHERPPAGLFTNDADEELAQPFLASVLRAPAYPVSKCLPGSPGSLPALRRLRLRTHHRGPGRPRNRDAAVRDRARRLVPHIGYCGISS